MPNTTGLIDVHAHLLPGIDDGCKTVAESVECCRRLAAAGYTHAFCTPHVWVGHPRPRRDSIPLWTDELQQALNLSDVKLKLLPGGEMNIHPRFTETPPERVITYGMTDRYVLAELWADRLPDHFEPSIRWLQKQGLTVILAHPERVRAVQDDPTLADRFDDMGVLLQGNLQCFADSPTARTRQVAEQYLAEDRYFMLGTDTHRPESLPVRLAGLQRVRELAAPSKVEELMRTNPSKLL